MTRSPSALHLPHPRRHGGPARRHLVLLLAAGLVLVGLLGAVRFAVSAVSGSSLPPAVDPVGVTAGSVHEVTFRSDALGRRASYDVYLPPHYARQAAAGRHFPVVYLLHPPPGLDEGMLRSGNYAQRADALMAQHRIAPMILVNPMARTTAYGDDTEWVNTRAGRYEGFVLDLVHNVDHRFSTRRDRRFRALSGVSMGGYGAVNLLVRDLRTFSIAQSWSGYFFQTPTGPYAGASPAQLRAASPYSELTGARARLMRRLGARAWLFQGTHDDVPASQMFAFARRMAGAGGEVRYAVFPGGHGWGMWRRQVGRMLFALDGWFASAPRAHAGSLERVA